MKDDLKEQKEKCVELSQQLKESQKKEELLNKLEIQIQEMEQDFKSAERSNQSFAFEKRSLLEQIDKLEMKLQEQKAGQTYGEITEQEILRSKSMLPPIIEESLLDDIPESVDLDSYVEPPKIEPVLSPQVKVMDLASQMVTSVPEESKIENFGDYGTESESAESDDEEDDKKEDTTTAAVTETAKTEDKTTSENAKKETENA